jgi:hypothetical protein
MAIQSFEYDAKLSAAFATFREELYRADLNWIPSSRRGLLAQFAPVFSFNRRSGNRHLHFMTTANGKVAGHVSAFVNRDLKDRDGTPVGALGFFECVDDYSVAADLLDHATAWLRKEHDLARIWAPVNFDIWHGYRFMTRGFEEKTFYGEPYNHAYYPGFFSRFGFSVKKTWDSLERWGPATLEKMIARYEPRYRKLLDEGYRFKSVDLSQVNDRRELCGALIRSYHEFLGITPFEFDDFERIMGQYLKAFEARFTNLIYDPRGKVAAFSVAYPDRSDAIRAMRGQDNLWARVRFHFHRGGADRVIFYMIGAMPEEIARRQGVGGATFYHTMRQILAARFNSVLFAIIADDSAARKYFGDEMRFAQRTYTLYELNR